MSRSAAPVVDGWPRHIAIIMDGNGRWAAARGRPRVAGHRAGAEAVRRTVAACAERGVEYLTLYAFSTENWTRPRLEVQALMRLLSRYLRTEVEELSRRNVRLRFIGDRSRLSPALVRNMDQAQAELARSRRPGLTLTLAINYGGRDEWVRAARRLMAKARDGELDPSELDETRLAEELDTSGLPDPDLVIRTAGECRLSNFLLWQSAYAELYFCPLPWPEFGAGPLAEAVAAYRNRQRKFGGLQEDTAPNA